MAALLLAVSVIPIAVQALDVPVSIIGYAYDGQGNPIVGASVKVELLDLSKTINTVTLADPPGAYLATFYVSSSASSTVRSTGTYSGRSVQNTSYFASPTTTKVDLHFLTVGPPQPPTGIEVHELGDDMLLNWTHSTSPDIDHYNIYLSTGPQGFDYVTPHAQTSGNNWLQPNGALNETEYYYTVRAVDNEALEEDNMYIVGKFRLELEPGWNLVSFPLAPFDGDLDVFIGDRLTGEEYQAFSDKIMSWDAPSQSWQVAWMYEGMAYPEYNGTWYYSAGEFEIEANSGYWIWIREDRGHPGVVLNSTGRLLTELQFVPVVEGWNLLGLSAYDPFSIDVGEFDSTGLISSGFTRGEYQSESDRVLAYSNGTWLVAWNYDGPMWEYQGFWYGDSLVLGIGAGFWIEVRDGHHNFTWNYAPWW